MSSVMQQALAGISPAVLAGASISFEGEIQYSGTAGTSITFTAVPIGVADVDRTVIQIITWTNAAATVLLNSATIGGIAARICIQNNSLLISGSFGYTAMISAKVPTGTTANTVVNFSATVGSPDCESFRALGLASIIPNDTEISDFLTVASTTMSPDVKTGGVVASGIIHRSGAGVTISGATEVYDYLRFTNTYRAGCLYANVSGADQAAYPIQYTADNGSFNGSGIAAAFMAAAYAPSATTIAYQGLTTPTLVSGTTYSVASAAIGAAATDRMVFCIVTWMKASTPSALTSATIGGVAATIHVQNKVASVYGLSAAIISALVPTGTTATVSLTFDAAASPGLGTYRVTGLQSTTPIDLISVGGAVSNPYTGTIDVPKNGILLFGGTVYGGTSATVTGATKDYDPNTAASAYMFGASLATSADEVDRAVSVGTSSGAAIVAASFR